MKRLLLLLVSNTIHSQNNKIFERLSAIENKTKTWYNIDGYIVTKETIKGNFEEKNLKKILKKLSLSNEPKAKDDKINSNNFYFSTTKKITDVLTQNESFYIIENKNQSISVIWFAKIGKTDIEMERELVNSIIDNKIPKENFTSKEIDVINFAGRKIALGNSCYWTSINTIQCPYFGEINWSVHKDFEDAQSTVENQLALTLSKKGGKIISEEIVDIEFENVPSKAKKIVYTLTGVKNALAGMSGGQSLTIYYVAEKVRGNYISCVLSHWNNDQINPETNLPPLLSEVMQLK